MGHFFQLIRRGSSCLEPVVLAHGAERERRGEQRRVQYLSHNTSLAPDARPKLSEWPERLLAGHRSVDFYWEQYNLTLYKRPKHKQNWNNHLSELWRRVGYISTNTHSGWRQSLCNKSTLTNTLHGTQLKLPLINRLALRVCPWHLSISHRH